MTEKQHRGRFILLTGLSGSGKSTLGNMLVSHLNQFGIRPAFLIDGDTSRLFFDNDLQFSEGDRKRVSRRMAFGAHTLIENNIDAIVSNIAFSEETRDFFQRKFSKYIEIFLDIDFKEAKQKDVKGVYKESQKRKIPNIVGHDIAYQRPKNPDLIIYPYSETPEESLTKIISFLSNIGPIIGTKADTLRSLENRLDHSRVMPQITLSWDTIKANQKDLLETVKKSIGSGPYIVRSSCKLEDSNQASNAGVFTSILNVKEDLTKLIYAANQVYDSYCSKKISSPEQEQILIQPMLTSVKLSGVIFTRYKYSDSPYYVINYDASSDTKSVTGGSAGKIIFLNRRLKLDKKDIWQNLIVAVRELEEKYPNMPLDIEFSITDSNEVILFQCRSLKVEKYHASLELNAHNLIKDLKSRIRRYQKIIPNLPGKKTILSDMADWNPAEIIGDKPNTLAYSLYRELFTSSTWHEARTSQGYYDILNGELMCSLARKPYIDVRYSFASLTPANISSTTREKLLNYYLEKLTKNKNMHDKVEFQILYTCYDLTTEDKIKYLDFLNKEEKNELISALKELTNNILVNNKADMDSDYKLINEMEIQYQNIIKLYKNSKNYWEYFQAAHLLFKMTKRLGAYPFARIARTAFIAHSILNSLVENKIMDKKEKLDFLSSIETAASSFYDFISSCEKNKLNQEDQILLEEFGHLRMNTYDITAIRYDQMPSDFWNNIRKRDKQSFNSYKLKEKNLVNISKILKEKGLKIDAKILFSFIRDAIQAREDAKLKFTKPLSKGLDFITQGSKLLGIKTNEVQNVTLSTLSRFRNPEFSSTSKAAEYLRHRIGEKISERTVFDLIKLPSLITKPSDIDYIEVNESKPNFITDKQIHGKTLFLKSQDCPKDINLEGMIVLIENADPGYDWIFTHNIKGLITKYGGIASHMAIRCNEFNIAGAIGCGELIFNKIEKMNSVFLDCKSEIVNML